MGKVLTNESNLQNIANAIRSKNGTQETYTPGQMSTAISNIPTGITPTGTISITENGNNIDVTNYASANVNVQGGGTLEPTLGNVMNLASEFFESYHDILTENLPEGITIDFSNTECRFKIECHELGDIGDQSTLAGHEYNNLGITNNSGVDYYIFNGNEIKELYNGNTIQVNILLSNNDDTLPSLDFVKMSDMTSEKYKTQTFNYPEEGVTLEANIYTDVYNYNNKYYANIYAFIDELSNGGYTDGEWFFNIDGDYMGYNSGKTSMQTTVYIDSSLGENKISLFQTSFTNEDDLSSILFNTLLPSALYEESIVKLNQNIFISKYSEQTSSYSINVPSPYVQMTQTHTDYPNINSTGLYKESKNITVFYMKTFGSQEGQPIGDVNMLFVMADGTTTESQKYTNYVSEEDASFTFLLTNQLDASGTLTYEMQNLNNLS